MNYGTIEDHGAITNYDIGQYLLTLKDVNDTQKRRLQNSEILCTISQNRYVDRSLKNIYV